MKEPEAWAALTLVTESAQPHEWWPIAWVLRYRVASPRFPDTMQLVVLQERQFSAWNPWTHGAQKGKLPLEEQWHALWATLDQVTREKLYPAALKCAVSVLGAGSLPDRGFTYSKPAEPWQAPFGPEVCWYYSPMSMIPKGTAPTWAAKAARQFTPSGIDPARFVFCEDVK